MSLSQKGRFFYMILIGSDGRKPVETAKKKPVPLGREQASY
jgi:hypothetical protein